MFHNQRFALVVTAALLCVSVDFIVTPFDRNGLFSNRTRPTRSVRMECDHETVLPHDSDGLNIPQMLAASDLVAAPARLDDSVPPYAEVPEGFHSLDGSRHPGEIFESPSIDTPLGVGIRPEQSRAPPVS